jgi:hypothetical protein
MPYRGVDGRRAFESSETLARKFAVMQKRRHLPECYKPRFAGTSEGGSPMRRREFIAGPGAGGGPIRLDETE